jgi:hypothetical protein
VIMDSCAVVWVLECTGQLALGVPTRAKTDNMQHKECTGMGLLVGNRPACLLTPHETHAVSSTCLKRQEANASGTHISSH